MVVARAHDNIMAVNFRPNMPRPGGYGSKPSDSTRPQSGGAAQPGPRPGWSGNTAPPRRPAVGRATAGAGFAPRNPNPFAQSARSAPQAGAQRLLSSFSIADFDRMSHQHLAQVVQHLGVPASQIPPEPQLTANWQAFRKVAPEDHIARAMMLKDPGQVAAFLVNGPPRKQSAPPPDASGAKPQATSAQQQAQRLMASFKLSEIDQMGHKHLAQVVQHLGIPAWKIPPDAQLTANWKAFRRVAPEDHIARAMILKDPGQVAAFLVNGPPARRSGQHAGASGSTHRPSGAPPAPPPAAPYGAAPRPESTAKPAHKPVKIAGMDRKAALQALKDRGMTIEMLKEMKQDMRNLVNHGNTALADDLQKKYAPYVSDKLTEGANHVHFAKMLMGV